MIKILAISGSLRKDSWNTKILHAMNSIANDVGDINFMPGSISELPLYNQDQETDMPGHVSDFKKQVEWADGIIIITPEHNRSIPSALKNAIDWASRPYGSNSWQDKIILLAGATPGSVGTAVAQADLAHIMRYLDARVIGQPELYVTLAPKRFDESGNIVDDTRKLLEAGLNKLISEIKNT